MKIAIYKIVFFNFDIDTETNKINTEIISPGSFPNRQLNVMMRITVFQQMDLGEKFKKC